MRCPEILPLLPARWFGWFSYRFKSEIAATHRATPTQNTGLRKSIEDKTEKFHAFRQGGTNEERMDMSIGFVCRPCTHMLTVPSFAEPACRSGGNLKVIRLRVPLSATAKGNRTPTPRSGLTIPVGSLISLSKCFQREKHAAETRT